MMVILKEGKEDLLGAIVIHEAIHAKQWYEGRLSLYSYQFNPLYSIKIEAEADKAVVKRLRL